MAPELEVWLFADRIGTLALVEGRLNFRYTPAWLSTARKLQSSPGHGFAGSGVVERIVALIEQRCALTIRRFSEPAANAEDVLTDF
ncbi:MAG: hypothetical protein IPN92_03830 [Chromatiaceae bacterium]|nr:hypothetical protein [Chromatiaceae bacterium]